MKNRVKRLISLLAGQFALLSVELLVVLALSVVSIIVFLQISNMLLDNELEAFDTTVYGFLSGLEGSFFRNLMLGATFLGNRDVIIWPCIGVLLYFLFIRPHRWYSITVPVVALGSIGMNLILKWYFNRPRPAVDHLVEASGLSFPSGHAMFSFSFYGLLIYITWRYSPYLWLKYTGTVLLFILIFLIGISRTYLGVHYASDVLAGFAAGLLWLVLSITLLKWLQKRIRERQKKVSLEAAATHHEA